MSRILVKNDNFAQSPTVGGFLPVKYLERPPVDEPISTYGFPRMSGEVPVFTGEELRPHMAAK